MSEKLIEPTYVTFDQAVLLKELGFNLTCHSVYYGKGYFHKFTMAITKPTSNHLRPEQWQVVEWLRLHHNIFIAVTINGLDKSFNLNIHNYKQHGSLGNYIKCGYESPQDAYSAAFDYILHKLIKSNIKDL